MPPLEISFAGYQKPESIHTRSAAYFGEVLAAELGDEISFTLIPSVTELGHRQGDMIRLVGEGAFDLCYIAASFFTTNFVPAFGAVDLPFVFDDQHHGYRVMDGPLGRSLAAAIDDLSPYLWLGYWCNGMRHLSNSVRPIRAPTDCRDLRIRTLASPLHGETFRALGMAPEAIDIAALLARSAAGSIDAQDNPLTNIFNFAIHELQPHITMTGHFWAPAVVVANKNTFRNWPGRVRDAVRTAAGASTRYQRELALAEDARIMALLEPPVEVVTLTPAGRAAFAGATAPVVDAHRAEFAEALEQIAAAA